MNTDIKPLNIFDTNKEEDTCSICLDTFNEKIFIIPECKHKFHTECLFGWLREHNECPLCRGLKYENTRHSSILRLIMNYSRRKNAPKNLVNIIKKYKKAKEKYENAKKEYNLFMKSNKEIIKEKQKLLRNRWRMHSKYRIMLNNIKSIPIIPLYIK